MKIIDTILNKTAANATSVSPNSTPTQQTCATEPATAAPPASSAQPDIEPDLLAIADDLAAKVRECQAHALGWQIMAAARLREYRDQLPPGDWAQVLKSGRLPVGARMGQMLARIAGHTVLRDMERTHQLPDSLSVLNELAGLPAPVVAQAISEGTIHPRMTIKQAKDLVRQRRSPEPDLDKNQPKARLV